MSENKNKLSKEEVELLLKELQQADESILAGVIRHTRMTGGLRKGIKSYFDFENKKSALKTGYGSTVKKVSGTIFTPEFSSILGALFDKKYKKKDTDAMLKQMGGNKGKGKGSGIDKQAMSKMKGDIIKNVSNKVEKESKKIQDGIKDLKEDIKNIKDDITESYSNIDDGIQGLKDDISEAYSNLVDKIDKMSNSKNKDTDAKIVKKVDANGRAHYHDTATKKFTSKKNYEEQYKNKNEGRHESGGKNIADSVLGLSRSLSNIQRGVSSLTKIAGEILKSVTEPSSENTVNKERDSAVKKSVVIDERKASELGGMLLKPDPADAHFLSPEMAFLEADEQERITRDALRDALQQIIKENPDAFKQDDGVLGGIVEAAVGAAMLGKVGKMFGGLIKGAKGIGGAIAGGAKKMFGGGAATAAASAAGEKSVLKGAETVGEKGLQTVGKETAETVAEKGAQTAGKEVAEKGAETVAKKAGTEVAETAAKKGGAKVLGKAAGKTVLKSVLKKIPVIGLVAGLGFAAARAAKGDWSGAAMEAASGVAGTLPGAGTAASVGIDAALAARDSGAIPGMGPPPETAADGAKPTPEKMKEATAQTLAPAVNKTTTNVTNQTTVNKQVAPTAAAATKPSAPATHQPINQPTPITKTSTGSTETPSVQQVKPLSSAEVMMVDNSAKVGVDLLKDPKVKQAYDLAKQQTATLAPAAPTPVGQQIIQGNQNIANQVGVAEVPQPAAAPAAVPNQINVTQNTMLPPDNSKSNVPKIDMETSSSTMERLARGDSDSPWAYANW